MLDTRELRIGNWVSYGGMYGYITVFNNNKVVIKCNKSIHKCYVHDLYPISLTEQWLLDFGFQKSYINGFWNGEFKVIKKQGHFILVVGSRHIHILYIHQLQNLYFALTGEDLHL